MALMCMARWWGSICKCAGVPDALVICEYDATSPQLLRSAHTIPNEQSLQFGRDRICHDSGGACVFRVLLVAIENRRHEFSMPHCAQRPMKQNAQGTHALERIVPEPAFAGGLIATS